MADYRIISSDSHVVEPPDLWTKRMDPRFGDHIPHLDEGETFDRWYCGGQQMGVLGGLGANTGMRFENPQEMVRDRKFAEVRPGGYDPHAHVQDNDVDGVYGSMIYPSIGRQLYSSIRDQELLRAIISAYNDWLAEFCAPYPDRLKGVPMVLLDDDIPAGIAEMRRCASLGLSGVMISAYPSPGQTYDSPAYEPFWAAAQDMGAVISFHASTSRPDSSRPPQDAPLISLPAADRINMEHWVRMSLSHMVLTGVFERYPDLKIVNVEHDAGWMPYFFRSADRTYSETSFVNYRFKGDALPSDFLRRNVYHSFQDDELAISFRDTIGVDRLMWGSDYPHAESTWPRSRQVLDRMLSDLPPSDAAKIAGETTAQLYGFN